MCREIDLVFGKGPLNPAALHEQLLNSISVTFIVVAGKAFKG
jgi:hypothetical protein